MTQTDIFNGEILKNPPLFFVGRGLLPPPFLFGQPSTFDYKKCFVYKEKKENSFCSLFGWIEWTRTTDPHLIRVVL